MNSGEILVFLFAIGLVGTWAMPGRGLGEKHMYGSGECPFMKIQNRCGNTIRNIYQQINGSCNNPVKEYLGSAHSTLKRLLPAAYADGIKEPRRAKNRQALPSSRLISNVLQDKSLSDGSNIFSHMFVQFGQFLTHDIVDTPKAMENGEQVMCDCESTHPECIKIMVPEGDEMAKEVSCIAMTRSKEAPGTGCTNKPRQHLNTISSFIDGTIAYGNNEPLFHNLRDKTTGLMSVTRSPSGDPSDDKLPLRKNLDESLQSSIDCPSHLNPDNMCFAAGEHRANENIGLSSCHAVSVREHNRIARELKEINPDWSDERLFQETKRIIAAITQVISYKEFLPALIGDKFMNEFNVNLLKTGYYYGYDASYDASISNAFATAAFRYGHSMVNEHIPFLDGDYEEVMPPVKMHKVLFNTELVVEFNHNDAHLMRGLLDDVAKVTDNNFVEEIRSKMFLSSTKPGRDLYAINIERGREHGLPGYNDYREYCGMHSAEKFSDLAYQIKNETIHLLSTLYNDVNDIDLLVGGLSETPLEGAAVGPTFACIIAYQFRDLRKGDRFWFENPDMFSEEQLQELRKASFSRMICDNVVGMTTVQPNAMLLKTVGGNERVPCDDLPSINLSAWKENHHVVFNKGNMQWTRWFLKTEKDNIQFLAQIRKQNSEQVCKGPVYFEEEEYTGEMSGKLYIRVRYLCPMGTISDLNFPKTIEGCKWTKWFDRDSPDYFNSDENELLHSTQLEQPGDICNLPLAIQARTVRGDLMNMDETLEIFHPSRGLVCKQDHQKRGVKCSDYKVRYLCHLAHFKMYEQEQIEEINKPTTRWTQWINLQKPTQFGERESLFDAIKAGYNVCSRPLQVNYRIAHYPQKYAHQILKRVHPFLGLICVNADQEIGSCHDYEVRYLCDGTRQHLG